MSELGLVFDIGGTNIRAGVYSFPERRLVRTARAIVARGMQPPEVDGKSGCGLFDQLVRLSRLVLAGDAPTVVAVAFPGPIDAYGNALAAPTIWGRSGGRSLPIKKLVQAQWPDLPIFVLNDVTAAGFRYLSHPNETLCVVTVSSGIGHKVFVNGEPLLGPNGHGGEIGHLRVDDSPEAPLCDCGHRGHLCAVASGRASRHQVLRLAREDPAGFEYSVLASLAGYRAEWVENEHLVAAYHRGDPWTEEVVGRMAEPLGRAIAAIHLTVGVERFVLVGGFAFALGARYREQIVAAASRNAWDLGLDWNRVVELGRPEDEAGLLGAGHYAAEQGRWRSPSKMGRDTLIAREEPTP